MCTVTLNRTLQRKLTKCLNLAGWRGTYKELGQRVNQGTGELTFDYDDDNENQDLHRKENLDTWVREKAEIRLTDGTACLDFWCYDRHFQLVGNAQAWLADIGGEIAVFAEKPDKSQILQAAVAAKAGAA